MGLGHCKTGNTKGKDDKFVVLDFDSEIERERHESIETQEKTLERMSTKAKRKRIVELSKYFPLTMVAKTMKRDKSSLHKWLKRNNVEVEKIITPTSKGQLTSVLTKDQVKFVMENYIKL